MGKRTITIATFKPTNLDGKLSDFLAEIEEATKSVPPEYVDLIGIEYDRGYEYGDEEINITYTRDETAEEVAEREAAAARYAQNRLDEKRRQYERLKAELGE